MEPLERLVVQIKRCRLKVCFWNKGIILLGKPEESAPFPQVEIGMSREYKGPHQQSFFDLLDILTEWNSTNPTKMWDFSGSRMIHDNEYVVVSLFPREKNPDCSTEKLKELNLQAGEIAEYIRARLPSDEPVRLITDRVWNPNSNEE